MKKGGLFLLCAAVFLLVCAAGAAWMLFWPTGVFNPAGPEETMQTLLDGTDYAQWKAELSGLWPQEVTEFENRDELFSETFDALAEGQTFTFRTYEGVSTASAPAFLVSAGENDLCAVTLRYADGAWAVDGYSIPAGLLAAKTRTLRVTAPALSTVAVNGVTAAETYITDAAVPYADMTELERRFPDAPHAVLYEIPGICGRVTVSADRDGTAQTLLYADGTEWRYAPPDAASHSFRILAPADAAVSVCGAALTESDRSGTEPLPLDVDVPEAWAASVPAYAVYEASGLYSVPEVTVAAADGTALEPVTEADGTLSCAIPGSETLRAELGDQAAAFLQAYCRYGAHLTGSGAVTAYLAPDTDLWSFIVNSQASLVWILGESVEFHSVTVDDFIPLGDGCCVCAGHVSCTTKTAYETRDLELDYQLLYVRSETGWLLQDMSYE